MNGLTSHGCRGRYRSDARMNTPARPAGNWRWRYRREDLTPAVRKRLRRLTEVYGRAASSRT